MDELLQRLYTLRKFVSSIRPDLPAVDLALPEVRRFLEAEGVVFKIVGGLAVVHHGYDRTTKDIDVLVDPKTLAPALERLADYGLARASATRLTHLATGVDVDTLLGGSPRPRPAEPPYEDPRTVPTSERDPAFIALAPLIEMKLHARRQRDLGDVVELLKLVDDGRYNHIEAAMPPLLRTRLLELRAEAIEELAFDRNP